MNLSFALSPLLIVALGAMLLMLAEAFGTRRIAVGAAGASGLPGEGQVHFTTGTRGLALGTTVVLVAGGSFAASVWLYGVDNLEGLASVAPWLIIDRFSLFFDALLCLGGALAALLAGGYLPEHNLDRGEFYALILFSTFGAMMLASAGDLLTIFLGLETMSPAEASIIEIGRAHV